ncbi:MAG: N-acetyltransferase [Treponema sp.]|nr:N-acetyltransferase [Treponema sp.]
MENDVRIRVAREDDASALLEIYAHYIRETAITFEYEVPSVKEFSDRIARTLERYPYFVAESSGKIAGYCYASDFHPRAAFAWDAEPSIYLKNDMRNRGIGRRLYAALEETLQKMNIVNLYALVACTQDKDDPHLTDDSPIFHAKMGYRTVGHLKNTGYKFNRWYDMIFMEKSLGDKTADMKRVIPFPQLDESHAQK